jgi:hypothetical protein
MLDIEFIHKICSNKMQKCIAFHSFTVDIMILTCDETQPVAALSDRLISVRGLSVKVYTLNECYSCMTSIYKLWSFPNLDSFCVLFGICVVSYDD